MSIGKIEVMISGPLAKEVAAHLEIRKALRREFQDALRLVLTMWGCEDASAYTVKVEAGPVVIVGQLNRCEMWREVKGGE